MIKAEQKHVIWHIFVRIRLLSREKVMPDPLHSEQSLLVLFSRVALRKIWVRSVIRYDSARPTYHSVMGFI